VANYENIDDALQGMVEVEDTNTPVIYLENKRIMLKAEITKLDPNINFSASITKIILDIIESDLQESHGQTCHKDTFGKIGPAGWKNSYSKKC
jgi:hypothetical protein